MLLASTSFCVKGFDKQAWARLTASVPPGQFLVLPPLDLAASGGLSPDGGGHCKHAIGKDVCVLSSTD